MTVTTVHRPTPVQPTHAWVITLQKPLPAGLATVTVNGTYTAGPGATYEQAYKDIRAWVDRQQPRMIDASVMFFTLKSNRL